jgi:hypothetical protein
VAVERERREAEHDPQPEDVALHGTHLAGPGISRLIRYASNSGTFFEEKKNSFTRKLFSQ